MNRSLTNSTASARIRAFCEFAGTHDPWEATVQIAEFIRLKSNQNEPPFDARLYCQSFNVSVEDQWLIDCDARLLVVPNGFIAEIQADHSMPRKRFSICHELAHVFFNRQDSNAPGFSCNLDSPEGVLEERLCDRLAVELLMPRQVFCAHAMLLPARFASVKQLADIFKVSLQAVMKRVVELNVWACGFVNYETSQCGAMSLQYWRVSDTWRDNSRSSYSANLLGNAIRSAGERPRRLVIPQAARSVQIEWYRYGARSRSSSICAFISAVPVNR